MFFYEMFGISSDYHPDIRLEAYKACPNMIQSAMKIEQADLQCQFNNMNEINDLYTSLHKG